MVDMSCDPEAIFALIICDCLAGAGTDIAIDRPIIISLFGQALLYCCADRVARISGTITGINDDPAAIIPTVMMMVIVMFAVIAPVGVDTCGKPAAAVMVAMVSPGSELALRLGGLKALCTRIEVIVVGAALYLCLSLRLGLCLSNRLRIYRAEV